MNVSFQIATYLAILRKHLVLLLVSAGLVVAAGFAYLQQQEPRYEAAAKLQISVPERSVMAARDTVSPFSINRQKLNTEIHLLRHNTGLANEVLDALRGEGIDVEAEGYTAKGLCNEVQVDFISGTDLVRFSLTGTSPLTLPTAVNEFARAYKRSAEEKSQRTYKGQLGQLQAAEDEAKKALEAAETKRTDYRNEHKELEWGLRENRYAARATELARLLPAVQDQAIAARNQQKAIRNALERLEIRTRKDESGYVLLHDSETGGKLEERLVDDEVIVALPFIETNAEVSRLIQLERSAARRDRDLEQRGDLPDTDARRAAQADLADARATRGRKMVQLVRKALIDIDDTLARFDTLSTQLEEVREQEREENRILAGMKELEEEVEGRQRDYDDAKSRVEKFMQMFVRESSQEEPDLGLRVDIAVPAETAKQIAPNRTAILGLTLFAALAISFGLVLLFEYLDDTIKSREDFDRYVGLPFLGFVPHISDSEADNPDLAADSKPGSPIAESFRAIRTSVMFSRGGQEVRKILVTSAGPGEGKTTVASNLAATLAKNKPPVLLIDADLRRPRVAKAMRVPNTAGLTNCLIGEASLDDVVLETSVEGLYVLPSGPIPPNPAELLHGEAMARLLEEVGEKYDRVVIDSPPVVAVTDARVLASQVDGLYMVISMGKTSRRVIQRALESITSIGFQVHGAILNNLSQPTGRYGYYYYRDYTYGKGYYRTEEPEQKAS